LIFAFGVIAFAAAGRCDGFAGEFAPSVIVLAVAGGFALVLAFGIVMLVFVVGLLN
jgi:hypothetical protein